MDKPIIFNTDSVRAILDGRKTQTRRTKGLEKFNQNPDIWCIKKGGVAGHIWWEASCDNSWSYRVDCPYGQAGDRLWVRETFRPTGNDSIYLFTDEHILLNPNKQQEAWLINHYDKNMPSIHMPRWASRINLGIIEIVVERLQEISPHELATTNLEREGLPWENRFGKDFSTSLERYVLLEDFKKLWDSLNAKRGYGWETNPWVWVISFPRLI